MAEIKLYNTLTRQKESLEPIRDNEVGLYTCGPTVYNYVHIGNLRAYIFEDVLQRALEHNGFVVKRVMNITDVGHLTSDADEGEDKLDRAAQAEKRDPMEIAKFYTEAFLSDCAKLNIEIPATLAPATEYIDEQIDIIKRLFERGFAYDTPNAVYFDVSKLPDYGKLSGQLLSEKETGAREEVVTDPDKHNAADFALWFKRVGRFEHHLLHWSSPWGDGFPGWHIECSAISTKFLGQPFDIHTGGVDHIGTHHANEIAQSEAAFEKPLANVWMHNEFLLVDNAKMSKSAGNFYTLKDIEERRIDPLAFRYLCLGAHYRSKLNFTWESIEGADAGLKNLYYACWQVLRAAEEEGLSADDITGAELLSAGQAFARQFNDAMADDLNTSKALAVLHEVLHSSEISVAEKAHLVLEFDEVFGLKLGSQNFNIPEEAIDLANKREEFRLNKQFMQADELRGQLEALGYTVDDTPEGPVVRPKQ